MDAPRMFGALTNVSPALTCRGPMPRPPPVSLERCVEQAHRMRASAAASGDPRDRARLSHMANAYDALAARIERGSRRAAPR